MLSQSLEKKSKTKKASKNVFFVYEFFTQSRDLITTDDISVVRKLLNPDNLVTVNLKVRMPNGVIVRAHTSRMSVKKLSKH